MSKNSGQRILCSQFVAPKHTLSIGMFSFWITVVKWICDILQEHSTKIVQQ